jgi:hypothetical protein
MVDPEQYRLSKHEIGVAREYAYRFFFEYPQPYPWHLLHLWDDIDEAPIEAVLSDAGMQQYGDTFRYLVGEPIDWSK